MSQLFPEQTIRYKTFVKRTMVDALATVFQGHPDALLQHTKVSIEYPKDRADYPAVLIRFFERDIFNAGVGHEEKIFVTGESASIEVSATVSGAGSVQLSWPAISGAIGYKLYRGTKSGGETQSFTITDPSFTDLGQTGAAEAPTTIVSAALDVPQPTTSVAPDGPLTGGTYYYQVTALEPSQAVRFKHYFYAADIEFAVYALSAYDRDLVADTVVQTIAMGDLEAYTNSFYERIYPTSDIYPDSELHFINVNSDAIKGFGERETQTPWGGEDDLLYSTSYRVNVFGELYSLPPKLPFAIVERIATYPYISRIDGVPTGNPADGGPWISNSASA